MATDYDAPRKTDDELAADSIEELKARRVDKSSGVVDEDEIEAAEGFELPGADLSGEELSVRVLPPQQDEFTCMSCFLVHHRAARIVQEEPADLFGVRGLGRPPPSPMSTIEVLVETTGPGVPLPAYAHPGDAGADMTTRVDVTLEPGERATVPTGIRSRFPRATWRSCTRARACGQARPDYRQRPRHRGRGLPRRDRRHASQH